MGFLKKLFGRDEDGEEVPITLDVERRIDRVSASFPIRTALRVRRRLYKMLK